MPSTGNLRALARGLAIVVLGAVGAGFAALCVAELLRHTLSGYPFRPKTLQVLGVVTVVSAPILVLAVLGWRRSRARIRTGAPQRHDGWIARAFPALALLAVLVAVALVIRSDLRGRRAERLRARWLCAEAIGIDQADPALEQCVPTGLRCLREAAAVEIEVGPVPDGRFPASERWRYMPDEYCMEQHCARGKPVRCRP